MAGDKSCEGKMIWECVDCGSEKQFRDEDIVGDVMCYECSSVMKKKLIQENHDVSEEALFIREKVFERNISYLRNLTPKQVDTIIDLLREIEANKKERVGTPTVDIECSNAIKDLKAIQREAKKATAALKELEEQRKRNNFLVIELDNEDDTLPRVFFKGKEVTQKVRVHFDWKTRTDKPGKLEVNVEYYEEDDIGKPNLTGIEIERLT